MTAKLAIRNDMRSAHCAPDDPGFRAWRLRQERRCLLEFGPSSRSQVHAPVMFELSAGCSVGCPFCGVAAQRLRSVFRHSEENAQLWRDVLARLHSLVGDACARGTCYYATEGLDNPDYELFLADILDEFGIVPQTTTAVSTRDVERTRALIRWGTERSPHVDRFSVLSPAMRDKIMEAFAPEELLLVELLSGRKHQIRVHLAHEGCPLLGDVLYGGPRHADGLMLHAWEERLTHPVTGEELLLRTDVPERFTRLFGAVEPC